MNDVAVLIGSCDIFSDIWPIAAELFARFWKDRTWPLYWMTNGATVPNIAKPIAVAKVDRLHWGASIIEALYQLSEPFVLLWHEEVLTLSDVPNEVLLEAAEIMRTRSNVGMIALTRYYSAGDPNDRTMASFGRRLDATKAFSGTMPALFRKDVLMRLLTTARQANLFEQYSHVTLLRDMPSVEALVPTKPMFRFCDNAIEHGPWRQCAVNHFKEMGIDIDVSVRGVHSGPWRFPNGTPA